MLLNSKYFDQTSSELSKLIIGSLTFVSALAWNEAFKDYFSNNSYLKGTGLWFYAIVTSIFAIIIIIFIKQIDKLMTLFIIGFVLFGSYSYLHLNKTHDNEKNNENEKKSDESDYKPSEISNNYQSY